MFYYVIKYFPYLVFIFHYIKIEFKRMHITVKGFFKNIIKYIVQEVKTQKRAHAHFTKIVDQQIKSLKHITSTPSISYERIGLTQK